MQLRALVVGSALVLAACGASSNGDPAAGSLPDAAPSASVTPVTPTSIAPPSTTSTSSTQPDRDGWPLQPPPVVFETPDGPLARMPFTVCWTEPAPADPDEEHQSYCADGMPEDDPPLVEPQDDRIRFSFDATGWAFSARTATDDELEVVALDDTTWSIVVPGGKVDGDGVVIVSGFGPAGDVHVAISIPVTGAREESMRSCVAAVDAFRAGLPTYEYEPAADFVSLVDRVDAVVIGTIDGVHAGDGEIELVLADVTTWGGSDDVTSVATPGVLDDPSAANALAGTPVIAFVHPHRAGRFRADVQGLFVQCPGGTVNVIEPLPDDPRIAGLASIDTLAAIAAERKAPVDPDAELHVGEGLSPDEIAAGEPAPVQVWWRCSVGLSVRVGDDLYLAAGDIEGLVPRPAREWVRGDFPDEWEVVIYNDVPVDGDDWVLLDAIAERIDDTTLEVRHVGTGDVVGRFVLDTTSPGERPMCG